MINKRNLWAKIQAFLLVVAVALPLLLKTMNIGITFKTENDFIIIDVTNAGLAEWVMLLATGILLSGLLCHFFRQENKEVMFNTGRKYKNSKFWWYQFCAVILGYQKCDLRGVPIFTIARMIVEDTFDEYNYGEINQLEGNDSINVDKIWINDEKPDEDTKEINLLIEDTYGIEDIVIKNIIANKNVPTLKISRDRARKGRWYVPGFVEVIWGVLQSGDLKNVIKINLYATTNPKNTKEIVEQVFCSYGRGKIKKLEVFQQESTGDRYFKKKGNNILL